MDALWFFTLIVLALIAVAVMRRGLRKRAFLSDATVRPLRDFSFLHKLDFVQRQRAENGGGFEHRIAGTHHGRKLVLRYGDGAAAVGTRLTLRAHHSLGERLRIERRKKPTDNARNRVGYPDFDVWFLATGPALPHAPELLRSEALRQAISLVLDQEQVPDATLNIYADGRVLFRSDKQVDLAQLDLILATLEMLADAVEKQAADLEQIKRTLTVDVNVDEGTTTTASPPSTIENDGHNLG